MQNEYIDLVANCKKGKIIFIEGENTMDEIGRSIVKKANKKNGNPYIYNCGYERSKDYNNIQCAIYCIKKEKVDHFKKVLKNHFWKYLNNKRKDLTSTLLELSSIVKTLGREIDMEDNKESE